MPLFVNCMFHVCLICVQISCIFIIGHSQIVHSSIVRVRASRRSGETRRLRARRSRLVRWCVRTCSRVRVCAYARMHVCTYARMHVYTYARMHMWAHTCMPHGHVCCATYTRSPSDPRRKAQRRSRRGDKLLQGGTEMKRTGKMSVDPSILFTLVPFLSIDFPTQRQTLAWVLGWDRILKSLFK